MDFILSTIKGSTINIINNNINNVHNVVYIVDLISIHKLIVALDYFCRQQIFFPVLVGNTHLFKLLNNRT